MNNIFSLTLFFLSSCVYAGSENPYFKGDYGLNLKDFSVENNYGGVDTIDPFSGNLFILNNDVLLPSNNGLLDIVVNRFYDMSNFTGGFQGYRKDSYEWNVSNGWRLSVAPRLVGFNPYFLKNDVRSSSDVTWGSDYNEHFKKICNKEYFYKNSTYKLMLYHIDGQVEIFFKGDNENSAYTASNWKVYCNAGNISLISPKGVNYEYGSIDKDINVGFYLNGISSVFQQGNFPIDLPAEHVAYMDPKKAIDPYGNELIFKYRQFGKKVEPIYDNFALKRSDFSVNGYYNIGNPNNQIISVESNDGRKLFFNYNEGSGFLESILDNNGRTWTYNYTSGEKFDNPNIDIVHDNFFLTQVVYPDNNKVEYDYFNLYFGGAPNGVFASYTSIVDMPVTSEKIKRMNSFKIKSITYPTKGQINYSYTYNCFTTGRGVICKPFVEKRYLSTGESWSYQYKVGSSGQYAQTIVQGPEGIKTYKFVDAAYNRWTGVGIPPNGGAPYQNTFWKIGKPIEIIDPLGSVTKFEWANRLVSSEENFLYEGGWVADEKTWAADLSKKTITRDGAIYTTEYQNYDRYGNPGKVIETGPNGENRTTIYTYYNDPNKWILSKPKDETTYNGSTLIGSITRNYDSNGNVLSENKDGIVNINTYDAQGNIATFVNANGATTTFSNYKRGIAQTEVQPEGVTITREVDNAGNVISETNGAGQKTSYTYDGLDRVTSITPPVGDKTTITYTATSKTTTRGNLVEVMNYDEFGRPKDSSKDGIKTTYKYDAFDNKIFESNPSSDKGTTISYDALNRVKTITNPDNTKQTYEYGKASTSITDERGKKMTYNYRSYGNPEEQHLMSITAPVADANVTLTRNGRDLVTTVKQKDLTRTYGYNSKYQLTSIDNPETGKTIYGRDNVGNMTSVKVGSLGTTTLTYDGRNRNTSITYPSGTAKVTKTYTKTDKLDMVDNTTVQRKFNYDANDNLSSETLTVDKQTFTTKYGYNTKDQLSSVTYPQSGTIIDYAPDALGRPTKVGNYVTYISYWPSGQFKQLNYANGAVSNYGQNDRLWPSSFDTKKGTVAHLNSNYTYDGVGNLLSIADSTDSNFNRTATYDDINRLITAQGPWGAGTLTYDGMGNITKQKFGSQVLDYVYNSTTNKLSSTSGSKLGTYSYDVMGNITSDGVNTYSYDAVPSLICAKCNDSSKRVDYNYDGLNKRVSVTKAGVKRYEILATNGDQLIEFIPSQNNKLTEYFYLGGKRIAQRISP